MVSVVPVAPTSTASAVSLRMLRQASATAMFAELSERGAVPAIDPALLYYILIGAGPTLYVHAPAYRRLTGGDPFSPATVDAHASAVIGLLFGPEPAPGS